MSSRLNAALCDHFFRFRYQAMRDCWNPNPNARPNFDELIVRLESTIMAQFTLYYINSNNRNNNKNKTTTTKQGTFTGNRKV